ncbi:MAG TPA: hypothetical protein VHV51_00080 [Polyangiaceae bacterium]|nr:hypothetical protein [Polyangiaceae bacterium]
MKSAITLFAVAAASWVLTGCGTDPPPPPQNPSTVGPVQPADSKGNPAVADPASGTSDLNSATNSASAPPGAPESVADPNGHAPVVSKGSRSGDTPINSGAGDAVPETKKP